MHDNYKSIGVDKFGRRKTEESIHQYFKPVKVERAIICKLSAFGLGPEPINQVIN